MPVYTKENTKILHIHVPKTGGSSIMNLFKMDGYKISAFIPSKHSIPCSPQHYHRELLEKHFDLNSFDYIFSNYRDPIERFKSQFLWLNKKQKIKSNYSHWTKDTIKNYKQNNFIQDNHIRPQNEFYLDDCDVYDIKIIDSLPSIFYEKNFLSKKYTINHVHKSIRRRPPDNMNQLITDFYQSDILWKNSSHHYINHV